MENISDIFRFDKKDVERYMMHELNMKDKFIHTFNYLLTNLKAKKIAKNLGKMKWSEGKSYYWIALQEENITLLIRRYRTHFTIYYKNKYKLSEYGDDYDDYYGTRYGAFTFDTDREKLKSDDEKDSYCDDNFKDINRYMKSIINLIKDNKVHGLWNSLMFKLDKDKNREEHIEVKNIWLGGDDISSIDLFNFALEEMFQKYLEMYSEKDMLEKIKTLNVGDMLGVYKVTEIRTGVRDDYFHDAGLMLQNTSWKGQEPKWSDVYSLSRWHYNDVFNIKEKEKETK